MVSPESKKRWLTQNDPKKTKKKKSLSKRLLGTMRGSSQKKAEITKSKDELDLLPFGDAKSAKDKNSKSAKKHASERTEETQLARQRSQSFF